MFQMTLVEKIKTLLACSINCFPKIVPFWGNVEKYGRARQAILYSQADHRQQYNTAYTLYVLDN